MSKRVSNRILLLSFAFFSIAIILQTSSCADRQESDGRIGVVVSILPLADFVEQVGGDKVKVTVVVPPGANPHSYEPKPSQLKAVSKAKIFVKAGTGVEFELVWMDKLTQINKNMMVLNSSKGIELVERDPHVWLSPLNAKKMVQNICEGLVGLDSRNEEYYTTNKENYLKQLDELDGYIRERLDSVNQTGFIVYHPAWGYMAREYNLEQIPVERAGKEPTAEEIRKIIEKANRLENKVVFVSPQFATKGAKAVAKEMGGSVTFLDPLPRQYVPEMRAMIEQLAQAMR